jgi:hypothetical protein
LKIKPTFVSCDAKISPIKIAFKKNAPELRKKEDTSFFEMQTSFRQPTIMAKPKADLQYSGWSNALCSSFLTAAKLLCT